MDTRTKIQKKRDQRSERIKALFLQYRSQVSKCRAAEMVADRLCCSKGTVINTIKEEGSWK